MKNTLSDLNNHLFEQLERLNDDDLKGEDEEEMIEKCTKCQVESLLLGTMAAELTDYQERLIKYAAKHWNPSKVEMLRKAIESLNESKED